MGLWTLLEGCLLLTNALAILNEDRFLAPTIGRSNKVFQGAAYGAYLCNPVHESSSYYTECHLHCCKASGWMMTLRRDSFSCS